MYWKAIPLFFLAFAVSPATAQGFDDALTAHDPWTFANQTEGISDPPLLALMR